MSSSAAADSEGFSVAYLVLSGTTTAARCPELLRQLPDWRAVIIRMNLAPAYVKIRPAWHRFMFRIGRHPLPAPHLASRPALVLQVPAQAQPELDLAPWPDFPEPEKTPVTANGNGNGHKPARPASS